MPLATAYPQTPTPARMTLDSFRWPAVEQEFDGVYRQVRQLTNRGLRRIRLEYQNISVSELDLLRLYFNLRKGKGERFDYKYHLDSLHDTGFEISPTSAHWTLDADTAISTASPRSGVQHGRITVPDPVVERRIRGVQKMPLFPGDEVTVSGFAKANNAAGGIGSVFVEFFTGADVFVAGGPLVDATFTTAYVQYTSGAVAVPGTVAYGKVSVRNTTGATIGRVLDFDDLSVKITVPCRFANDRMEWEFRREGALRYSLSVELEESP